MHAINSFLAGVPHGESPIKSCTFRSWDAMKCRLDTTRCSCHTMSAIREVMYFKYYPKINKPFLRKRVSLFYGSI